MVAKESLQRLRVNLKILDDKEFFITAQDERYLVLRKISNKGNKFILKLDKNKKISRIVNRNIDDDELAEVLLSMILEDTDGEWIDEEGRSI